MPSNLFDVQSRLNAAHINASNPTRCAVVQRDGGMDRTNSGVSAITDQRGNVAALGMPYQNIAMMMKDRMPRGFSLSTVRELECRQICGLE